MAEYIKRDAVFKAYEGMQRRSGPWHFEALIESIPAADVASVVHGHWFDVGSLACRCSNCGCKNNRETNYCPSCGAKMDS